MAKLGINIDHVATLRQARGTKYPDPIAAAAIVEDAGADQVTCHLREDRRHIQDADLFTLRKVVRTSLNLELAAVDEIVTIASDVRPNVATFVPERRQELTTEGGLDVIKNFKKLRGYVNKLKENSILVSLFIDPDLGQVDASRELGVDAVELHTGRYAGIADCGLRIADLKKAATRANELGLYVAAGHGLNYDNTARIVKEIPEIVEYNIGHAVIARAVFVGLAEAVREMKALVSS